MSSNHKSKKNSKICPECNSWMELMEVTSDKNGIIYSHKQFECIECGYVDIRKNKKDNRIPLRDWGME